jgi:hypothetical protein
MAIAAAAAGVFANGRWWARITATRFLLRHYFQAHLPAFPDATFWSAAREPYIFEPVR